MNVPQEHKSPVTQDTIPYKEMLPAIHAQLAIPAQQEYRWSALLINSLPMELEPVLLARLDIHALPDSNPNAPRALTPLLQVQLAKPVQLTINVPMEKVP